MKILTLRITTRTSRKQIPGKFPKRKKRLSVIHIFVSGAAGVIGGDTNIDVTEALAAMQEGLKDMEIPELLLDVYKRQG